MTYNELYNKIGMPNFDADMTIMEKLDAEDAFMVYYIVKNGFTPKMQECGLHQILADQCQDILRMKGEVV